MNLKNEIMGKNITDKKQFKEKTDEFWNKIIRNEDGSLNERQIFNELADYSHMLDQVPKIYDHITGGILSKSMYFAHSVTSVADDHYRDLYLAEFKEFLNNMHKAKLLSKTSLEELSRELKTYF